MNDDTLLALIRGFGAESDELTQKATRALLALEQGKLDPDAQAEAYDATARAFHTLKGSAAMLGLGRLSQLVHGMETLLQPLAGARATLPRPAADALLHAIDAFLQGLKEAADQNPAQGDAEVTAALARLLAAGAAAPVPEPTVLAESPVAVPPAPSESREAGEATDSWRVEAKQVLALMREVERIREVRLRLEERRRALDRELVVLGRLPEAGDLWVRLMGVSRGLYSDGEEAADTVVALEGELKAVCTSPVRAALEPLPRAVRDLCRALGKEANLSVVGAELSLDRRVIDGLRGSLVHLVRNAIAHGVEPPARREQRGKHREGALVIRIEQAGNVVSIEVSDDGQGLDERRIREVAEQRGLASAAQLATMPVAAVRELIFQLGFSTAGEVSETSGRGVGLDAVRSQVQRLSGAIEVQSAPGQGTRFVITVPIELGSSPILLVRVGEHTFGLPLAAVETGVVARADALRIAAGRAQLAHRDTLVPIHDLSGLLRLQSPRLPVPGSPMVVVQARGRKVALLVDQVLGDQELLIRPMPPEVRPISAYQGAATMALGELLLVLNPSWLVTFALDTATTAGPGAESRRRALVVDDSISARAIYRSVLESGGYLVHVVGSTRQAEELIGREAYDVVLVDVMLGDENGMDLVAALRAKPETAGLPALLISADDSDNERRRGVAAGADAFLGKRECASTRLLTEVAAAIARRAGRYP